MNITNCDADKFISTAREKMVDTEIVLDIGCGIRPQNYTKPRVHICVDPHKDYLDHLQKRLESFKNPKIFEQFTINEYCTLEPNSGASYIFINGDWEKALTSFPEKSVDSVFLMDVIEHLDKETGKKLLAMTEKLARRQFILFTPLGFVEQDHDDERHPWGLGGENLQKHLSGWVPEDFSEDWEFVVCRDFHSYDTNGNKYDEPKGAFFGIKNITNDEYKPKEQNIKANEISDMYSKLSEYTLAYENDLELAQKYIKTALEFNPDNPNALNNLGVIHWNNNEPELATEILRKVYESDKSNKVFVTNYIDVLNSAERKDEALDILNKYLKYHSHDDEMKELYTTLTGKNWDEYENVITSNLEFWKQMQNDDYFENHMYYGAGTEKLPLYGDDLDLIRSFVDLNEKMNVAIIGCGYGRESVFIGPHVKHIYGIDVTKKILDKAVRFVNKHGVFNFTPVLAESWRYDLKEKLDLVFELTVFQHLTRDLTEDYIGGMAEKLNDDGKMLLQFMDCEYGTPEAEMKKYEPCVNWKMPEIELLASKFGLKILKEEHKHWPEDCAYWHWVLFGK